jgi:hypothetical protein
VWLGVIPPINEELDVSVHEFGGQSAKAHPRTARLPSALDNPRGAVSTTWVAFDPIR